MILILSFNPIYVKKKLNMKQIQISQLTEYVENNIGKFHTSRLESMASMKLTDILKRKNPYLFKAKDISLSQDLVKTIIDAYLSSQEETIFGNFLEGLAIFINSKVYGGQKSGIEGIDLEFADKNVR
jgi:hypothetical protein